MTTTRIYKSTDSSAPVLTGQASSLIDLLDACLVNGYGSQTAAGWTKPYTGTDKAAFRNSVSAGGTGMYLRVLDDGSGTGGAREALVRGYHTMSDVDTGTVETPTAAQVSTSLVWRKSNTTNSTARSWWLIADERTFYLCVNSGTLTGEYGAGLFGAGDIDSWVPGDVYGWFVVGRETQQGAGSQGTHQGLCTRAEANFGAPTNGFWLPSGYAGIGSPIRAAIAFPTTSTGGIGTSTNSIARPAPGSGLDMWIAAWIGCESTIRGSLRGLYAPLHDSSGIAIGTEFSAPPGLPSAVLVALGHGTNAVVTTTAAAGRMFVDRVGPWP